MSGLGIQFSSLLQNKPQQQLSAKPPAANALLGASQSFYRGPETRPGGFSITA